MGLVRWSLEALKGLLKKPEPRKIVYEVNVPAFLMLVAHYKPPVLLDGGSIGQDYSTSFYSFQTDKSWFRTRITYHLWTEDILDAQGDARLDSGEEEFFKALRTASRNGMVIEPHKFIPKGIF